MIVKCEQCQTRFKIPDEKVTDKGVKVRCTKCGHTFRVAKEGGPAIGTPSAGSPATQTFPVVPPVAPVAGARPLPPAKSVEIGEEPTVDPFSAFGRPPKIPDDEATRPGVFVLGVEASRVPDIGAAPIPPQAPTPAVGSAFDFSSLAPPGSALGAAPAAAPPLPRPVPRSSSPSPAGATAAAPAPFDFSSLVPTSAPSGGQPAPFDFSALGTAPAAAPAPPSFDFSSLAPTDGGAGAPLPAAPAPLGPPPAVTSTPAFDFSGLGPPPPSAPAVPPPQIPLGSQPGIPMGVSASQAPRAQVPAFAPSSGTGTQPAIASPWGTTGSNPAVRPQSSAPMSLEEPGADAMPALFGGQPQASADDFFGGSLPAEEKRAPLPDDLTGDAARSALFDMAAALPAAPPDAPAPAQPAPPAPPEVASVPVARFSAPRPQEPEVPRGRRTALGIVVNLVIAAVLVVALVVVGSAYLNEGEVTADTLSWAHLKATFAPGSDFVAGDISNGLYDTKAGKAVFFVRGDVTNRGTTAVRVMVKAELLEGDTLVRAAESAAGAPASPEDLYLLTSAEDLEALNVKVAERAPVLEPGASAPFVVAFFEYPPDLKGFRVRVSARSITDASTAKREP